MGFWTECNWHYRLRNNAAECQSPDWKYKWCFMFLLVSSWFVSFLFSGILPRIFLRFSGILCYKMSFWCHLLIGKVNGVSRCKQLGLEKLLLILKSIVVMLWDFSLEFSVAIFLSILTERFGGVMLEWFCLVWCKFCKSFTIPLKISWRIITYSLNWFIVVPIKLTNSNASFVEVILAYSLMKFFLSSFKLFTM